MTLFILTLRSCRSESRKDHLIIFAVFSSKKNKKRKKERERERSHQHQRGDLHHGGSATRGEDSQREERREEEKREERREKREEGRKVTQGASTPRRGCECVGGINWP